MTKTSNLGTEDFSQCLPKVRTDIKNGSQKWTRNLVICIENREKWTKIQKEQTERNFVITCILVFYCCSESQMNELMGTGNPFFVCVCVYTWASLCTY